MILEKTFSIRNLLILQKFVILFIIILFTCATFLVNSQYSFYNEDAVNLLKKYFETDDNANSMSISITYNHTII